jgi:hypothetical protein
MPFTLLCLLLQPKPPTSTRTASNPIEPTKTPPLYPPTLLLFLPPIPPNRWATPRANHPLLLLQTRINNSPSLPPLLRPTAPSQHPTLNGPSPLPPRISQQLPTLPVPPWTPAEPAATACFTTAEEKVNGPTREEEEAEEEQTEE